MNIKLLICALCSALAGCDAISPFVDEDLKDAMCDRDVDGLARTSAYCGGTDCDDENADVGVLTWHVDFDQDGYGTQSAGGIVQCAPLSGYASRADDCDDAVDTINPSATEVCDGIDNDCDEALDELDPDITDGFTRYQDLDDDSWGSDVSRTQCEEEDGWVEANGDCDDADAGVNPLATELCEDGIDQNCNGEIDTDAVDVPWYRDADEDGYGDENDSVSDCVAPDGYVEDATDCNDEVSLINPGVKETCNNGIDDNCDGSPETCVLTMGTQSVGTADIVVSNTSSTGWSSTAGDLDRDGENDLVLGVPNMNTGGYQSGGVYVFFSQFSTGELGVDDANLAITGIDEYDHVGYSVSVADVTNDGWNDLIVGAPHRETSGADPGAVYVFFGPFSDGQTNVDDADATMVGASSYSYAGHGVETDDFNNDSIDDLAIGAPADDSAGTDAGAVYVFFGPIPVGEVGVSNADLKITGEADGSQMGSSLAGAGDVNNDDIDDLAIGAPSLGAGAVYVLFGSVPFGEMSAENANLKLTGEASGNLAGYSLVTAGDVNNDGIDDLAVGAMYEDTMAYQAGAAYLVYGDPNLTDSTLAEATHKWIGEHSGAYLGRHVNLLDVNGDGVEDVIMATWNEELFIVLGLGY